MVETLLDCFYAFQIYLYRKEHNPLYNLEKSSHLVKQHRLEKFSFASGIWLLMKIVNYCFKVLTYSYIDIMEVFMGDVSDSMYMRPEFIK